MSVILGGYSAGVPPLPIPNREVKPVSADGTAIPSGRVGSRQPSGPSDENLEVFFFASHSIELSVFNIVLFKNVHVMSIKPYHRAQKPKVTSLADYTRIVAIFIMIAVVVLIALL